MSVKVRKNVAASVLARLRNVSKANGAPFQQVLQHYAIERFLYRVSRSLHAQSVVLKGALLLKTIGIPRARPTVDIDMLRRGKSDAESLVALVKDCATMEGEADGVTFLPESVVAEAITKDSEYLGTRILMGARIATVRLRIQVDFGVGDAIIPGPRVIEYPVFLGHGVQWNAFVRRVGEHDLVGVFDRVVRDLRHSRYPSSERPQAARNSRSSGKWAADGCLHDSGEYPSPLCAGFRS